MRVTEFLEGRNVERQAVTRYINRHGEIFKGHTKKVGKELDLDSVAVEELAKVYPFPKPVIIQQGVPQEEHDRVKDELIASLKRESDLKNQLIEVKEKIAGADASLKLLEDRNRRIASLEAVQSEKDAEIKELRKNFEAKQADREQEIKELRKDFEAKQSEKDAEIKMLQDELMREKSKTWLQRLFGK